MNEMILLFVLCLYFKCFWICRLHHTVYSIFKSSVSLLDDIIQSSDLDKLMNRLSLLSSQISSSKQAIQHSFKGKTIVVTGGSRGIGLAIAKKCAKDGANVAILAKTT